MSRLMSIYGLTANEALQLTDSQVAFMLDHATVTAEKLLANNSSFKQALGQSLSPVARAVRSEVDSGSGGGGGGSSSGGPGEIKF
jgi:uncharacterized membrane protein